MFPIWVQLKSQSPDGKHPQQIFANTENHIIRTGTANAPLMHQTALKYEMEVSDGGRLEFENSLSKGAQVVLFVVRESLDDFSDLTKAPESTLEFWDKPTDDTGWNDA